VAQRQADPHASACAPLGPGALVRVVNTKNGGRHPRSGRQDQRRAGRQPLVLTKAGAEQVALGEVLLGLGAQVLGGGRSRRKDGRGRRRGEDGRLSQGSTSSSSPGCMPAGQSDTRRASTTLWSRASTRPPRVRVVSISAT